MNYLSVCSGIEAATVAWNELDWNPAGFSEIESFPSAVLQHHYPEVTNFGDMTKFKEWNLDANGIDLLVGGTPCQSFSVAGLRKGLDDPRGNLALTYCSMLDYFRPTWFIWENVPGVLSSSGGRDFACFLDALEELGYICDIEILDAQFHGVAQRRRRVFVCGQHRDDLLSKRTTSSALTISQCLVEILHGILAEEFNKLGKGRKKSESAAISKDGAVRRMKLFGLLGEQNNWQKLLWNLEGEFLKCQQGLNQLDAILGENQADFMQGDLWSDIATEGQSMNTEVLWKKDLEEICEVMKSCITLTAINSITPIQIYMSFRAVLTIGKLICLTNSSCPSYWSAASSTLILLKEYTNYARQTSIQFSKELVGVCDWNNLIRQAERLCDIIGNTRVRSFGEILSFAESLRRDSAPSREKGQEFAGTIAARFGISRNNHEECVAKTLQPVGISSGADPHTMATLCATDAAKWGSNQWVKEGKAILQPSYGIPGNWIGRAPENGGNAVEPMHDIAPCLTKTDRHGVAQPIGFEANMSLQQPSTGGVFQTLTRRTHASVLEPATMAVRRITPVECERLQGFPDNYTNIPWRKKDESPDGPRYKALGNSMAVPVMKWIGERIKMVDELCN